MTQRNLALRSWSWLLVPCLALTAGCPAEDEPPIADGVADGGSSDAGADRAAPADTGPAPTPDAGPADTATPAEDAAPAESDAVVLADAAAPSGNTVRLKLFT